MNKLEVNKELLIFVTNVEVEDDAYLKIWGQLDRNAVGCVENLLHTLEKYFATSRGLVGISPINLRLNKLCCAKFENVGYCRARILSIHPDGMVVVRLIDYGTTKVLQPQDVHLLENIRELECLHSYPPLAYDFILMDILPVNMVWDTQIVESIRNILWQNEHNIVIHSILHNYRFIKLQYHGEDFGNILVSRHMALPATLPEIVSRFQEKRQVPLYQHPHKRGVGINCSPIVPTQNVLSPISSDGNNFQQNVTSCCAIQQKHLSQSEPMQEALVFKSHVLDVGHKHEVSVSFVEDGPHKFSVQVHSNRETLSALMRDMNNHSVEPLQEPPIPGSVCMGRYTRDKVLCRAVVMSVAENKCKVYYVDFGHTEVLPYTDIYQLPPHFIRPKVFSIRFTLSGVKELNVTEEMKEYFKNIVSSKLLTLHVRPPEGPPLVQYGDLYDGGQNIKHILIQAFPSPPQPIATATYQQPPTLSKGMDEIVYVSFVESYNKFFAQLDSSSKALESIMDCLAEYCKTAPVINPMQMRMGFPCAALYENQWYRAQILNVTGDKIQVLYIDYGNEETVNIMSLRLIHEDLVRKLQAQAIRCALHGWEALSQHKDASAQFDRLTLEKRFVMKIRDVHSDRVVVDLYDPETMDDIKSQLLQTAPDVMPVNVSPNYHVEERAYAPKISNTQVSPSNTTDEWQKKSSPGSWNSPDNNIYGQEKSKTKSFKDELNEERRYDMKTDKSNASRSDPRNDRFNRSDSQYNARNSSRDKWNNKFEPNDSPPFNKGGRSPRGGRTRAPGNSSKLNHSSASEKSFSDKDSDVSNKSGTRRGRGNSSRGGSSRRDGGFADTQSNKWNDRDSDGGGGIRSARGNSDSYGGNKYKERRGQGYRIARYKTGDNNSYGTGMSDGENGHNFHPSSSFGGTNEEASGRGKVHGSSRVMQYNYAPLNSKWTTATHDLGSVRSVIITWFINPTNFFCQTLDKENEFRTMMNELQKLYAGREPVSSYELQTGSPVIALFADDGALYRAEVLEANKPNGHLVQYIDFGNTSVVSPQKVYAVETKLMDLPKQAVQCSLKNITTLKGTTWAKVSSKDIDNCFNADKFECTFHDITNGKYAISLSDNGNDVASVLVNRNLAMFTEIEPIAVEKAVTQVEPKPNIINDVQRIDITLLSGQTLRVKVSSVENASKFFIQLPSATETENIVNTYMSNNDPKVMQRLSAREMCMGTGCLICTNGVWRRGVIIGRSKSDGFDVKFIDTGANDEILSDSVLALPGELSVMQNQAIECLLQNASSTPANDKKLRDIVEGKDIILHIEEVDNNRLITTLFDLRGNKITLSGEDNEKICPVCPMPVLTSTHRVSVSFADHSASVWLQRYSEYELDVALAQTLQRFYANSGKPIDPQVGHVCAARSADGNWYRGKIINCSQVSALVNFMDYGNNEEIGFDSLMELDSEFYTPHQLAINVSLPVTLNCPESEQLSLLQTHLSNKELTAVFNNKNKKLIAELIYEGEKISEKLRQINLDMQEATATKSPSDSQSMEPGCKYEVYISHMDSPTQFWIHCADEADDLAKIQEKLQSEAPTFPAVEGILEEGTLCIAIYSFDNMWYRAQVLDADEDITTLRFIDYGNTDTIDNNSGKIKCMPDTWREVKEYAVQCRLNIVPIDSEDWSEEIWTRFQNLVNSVESVQALIITSGSPKRVDLFVDEKSVSDTLVEEKCAIMMMDEDAMIDEIVDLELDPHSAFVSHINSPSEFWVQEQKSVSDLEIMSDRFMVADMFPKVDEIKEGMLCVAKYPEDKQWYRGRIISCENNTILVLYIDYGNSAVSTEIRAIPEDLAGVPALSRKCCLVTPDGVHSWSEKACDEFIKLSADGATIFLLDVLKEEETSSVKLTLNGESVADILAPLCEHYPTTEERLPPLGEEDLPNVIICRVNTLEDFWIQTQSDLAELDVMADLLKDAENFQPLTSIEAGSICAAKFSEDGLWYRARILSHSESDVEVLYIDYGNSDITTEVRTLPEEIAKIPHLARHCVLLKPDKDFVWSAEALDHFIDLANDESEVYQLKVLDASDPSLVQLSRCGQDIGELLCSPPANAPALPERETGEENMIPKSEIEESSSCIQENTDRKREEDTAVDQDDSVAQENYLETVTSAEVTPNVEDECKRENDDINKQSGTEIELEVERDVASFIPSEITCRDENLENEFSGTTVKELTVDEIVQSMERNPNTSTEEQETTQSGGCETMNDPANLRDATLMNDEAGSSYSDENVKNTDLSLISEEAALHSINPTEEKKLNVEEAVNCETICASDESKPESNAVVVEERSVSIEKSEESPAATMVWVEPTTVAEILDAEVANATNLAETELHSNTAACSAKSKEEECLELHKEESGTENVCKQTQIQTEEKNFESDDKLETENTDAPHYSETGNEEESSELHMEGSGTEKMCEKTQIQTEEKNNTAEKELHSNIEARCFEKSNEEECLEVHMKEGGTENLCEKLQSQTEEKNLESDDKLETGNSAAEKELHSNTEAHSFEKSNEEECLELDKEESGTENLCEETQIQKEEKNLESDEKLETENTAAEMELHSNTDAPRHSETGKEEESLELHMEGSDAENLCEKTQIQIEEKNSTAEKELRSNTDACHSEKDPEKESLELHMKENGKENLCEKTQDKTEEKNLGSDSTSGTDNSLAHETTSETLNKSS